MFRYAKLYCSCSSPVRGKAGCGGAWAKALSMQGINAGWCSMQECVQVRVGFSCGQSTLLENISC
jgi:hypothetical protein